MERAVQHDVRNGIEAARTQIFGAGDEVAGRIVDQAGERAIRPHLLDHAINGLVVFDIDLIRLDGPARGVTNLGAGGFQHGQPASANCHFRTEAHVLLGHDAAQPGTAACDEYLFRCQ